MSLEEFARAKLSRDLIGFRKNGLNDVLRDIMKEKHYEDMELDRERHGFIPDGSRLRRQPAHNPLHEPYDMTIELWEIEDTSKITDAKLSNILLFGHSIFDVTSVFTEVWICDRYGTNRRKIIDIRDELLGGSEMNDHKPYEWYVDGEWKQS